MCAVPFGVRLLIKCILPKDDFGANVMAMTGTWIPGSGAVRTAQTLGLSCSGLASAHVGVH